MANDFDLREAETVLTNAQAALPHGYAHDRIAQFPGVVDCLDKAIGEVKALRTRRAALLSEALSELNALMLTQLDDALQKHDDLRTAVRDFRDRNYYVARGDDGKYRWTPRDDSKIHEALENLSKIAFKRE